MTAEEAKTMVATTNNPVTRFTAEPPKNEAVSDSPSIGDGYLNCTREEVGKHQKNAGKTVQNKARQVWKNGRISVKLLGEGMVRRIVSRKVRKSPFLCLEKVQIAG
jgi:hypothetical protein